MVVLQQRDAAVAAVEGHVGFDGADVGVDLARVTLHVGLNKAGHTNHGLNHLKTGWTLACSDRGT